MPESDQPAKAPKKRVQLQPKKPKPKKTRGTLKDGIREIQQEPRIVLVAPHGVMGDDDRTDLIAYEAQGLLNCAAVINKSIKRDDTNLNDFVTASQCHPFFYPLERMLSAPKFRLVVWIHGGDENGKNWKDAINAGGFGCKPEEIDAFIGYGQGSTEKDDRLTANLETAEAFRDELTSAGMVSVLTGRGAPRFRGWAWDNMNQYLNRMKVPFDRGQSLQIEIRNKGFRNTPKNAKKTAEIIFKALKAVKKTLPPPPKEAKGRKDGPTLADLTLAEEAYIALRNLFVKHVTAFMVEAGDYVIKTFYNDNPRLALAKNKAQDNPPSLKALTKKIRTASAKDPSRGIPSLSWFYNSVNLAAHLAINKELGFQTFGILPHSHKLLLLHFPPLKDVEADKFVEAIQPAFEEKDKLAQIAAEKPISVRDFAKILREKYPRDTNALDLDNLPARAELRERDAAELVRLYSSAKSKIENGQKDVKQYKKALDALGAVIAERTGETEGEGRFQDWTDSKNNINICTGCEHDCLYCYMKPIYNGKPGKKQPPDWGKWEIQQEKVDAPYRLKDGLVGFPSSHDVFPEILDAYLAVLGKLLRAGNDVLIVSKPHLECIQAICSACAFFKDKILFRFTIGANDNDILSYWEPNAPNYEHRKECLAHARAKGFHTSVSIEPMLDTARIEQLVADLDPLVSEDIWLGMMSHLGALQNWAKLADFGKRKAIVQAGQTPEILTAVYDAFSGNPKVKFKTETLKVILEHLKQIGRIKGEVKMEAGKLVPGGEAPPAQ
ncbi:MAG: radical SAM protein [Desulfobacterales bacterium]|nr:radical SAM protein [Desulfobacterales bacterium]